jgi:hypothetical protein
VPGEFVATYESVEAMRAAPQDNAKSTTNNWGSYYADTATVYYSISSGTQVLYFEDIASIANPCERFAAKEAKRQEIWTWPGVKHAEYNSISILEDPVGPSE